MKAEPVLRPPAEDRHAVELGALVTTDREERPPGWKLSPRAVRTFICGSEGDGLTHEWEGSPRKTVIARKFHGDDPLVERAIIGLAR